MRQGIDIREVEARTKIRAKYIRALENEEFEGLPGSTFTRTFLRTYAEFLGLDPQLLVEEYRARHETSDDQDLQPFGLPPPTRERRVPGPPSRGVVAMTLIVALLAFLLVLGLTGGDGGEAPPPGKSADQTAKQREQRARSRREAARRRRQRAAALSKEVSLQVAPVEQTYLCVDDGTGDVIFEGVLEEPRTFKDKRLRLNLGRTSAKLRVNGKPVPLQAGPAAVGLEFTPRGRKLLPEAERPCV